MIEDHGEIQLETTEGWRPDPSRGERVLVALAAVALVGAVLIVGANLLNRDDEVSVASTSPRPTASPVPSPLPSPSPRELVVVEQQPSPAETPPPYFGGWIRATVALPIWNSAGASGAVVGTLPAGGLAYADQQDESTTPGGWLYVEAPDPVGFVQASIDGADLVRRYQAPDLSVSGGFASVAAGPGGFVAIGTPSGRSANYPQPTVFASADGVAWHRASEPPGDGSYLNGVAWGPAGWLAIAGDGSFGGVRLWTSRDGDRWSSLGVVQTNGYPEGLVASGAGYLLKTGSRAEEVLWFSTEGIRWSESRPTLDALAQDGFHYTVTATQGGFYATSSRCCQSAVGPTAAFSTDGRTWYPSLPNLLVAAVDGVLLGIEPGPDGPGASTWRGSLYRDQVGWLPMPGGDPPFMGAVVTALVSDGRQATAFGWDVTSEASLAWTSDGSAWTRHELPTAFGGPPSMAAGGGVGTVVVGNRWNSRGPNPVVWHANANGSWAPERSPVIDVAPDPSPGECGAPPTDAAEFVNLDRNFAAACWGDMPLTIRMWSARCDGCFGGSTGTYDEAWLSNPTSDILFLSPVEWADNWSAMAILSPVLGDVPEPGWLGSWLELTGHFDDPAAASCHWTPSPEELLYYSGSRPVFEACRQQFVVTAVRVVDGP